MRQETGLNMAEPRPLEKDLFSPDRTIVLVGLMGAGKSSVGKRLANALHLPFSDSDVEVEEAAGLSISDIYDIYGADEFHRGENRVIARLLQGPIHVIATGGSAFLNPENRKIIREKAISVWLRADLDLLVARTTRQHHRPTLRNCDRRQVLETIMRERADVFAEADIVVDCGERPLHQTVEDVIGALREFGTRKQPGRTSR